MNLFSFLKGELSSYAKNIGRYTKYQVLTKTLLFIVILPIFNFGFDFFLKHYGRSSISSGDYRAVLFSLRGLSFVLFMLIILVFVTLVDINSFIAISSSIKQGRTLGFRQALRQGLASLRSFFSPAGLFLLLYALLIVSLAGVGLKLSSIKSLKIPNFISSVIYNNGLYLSLYLLAMLLLSLIGFLLIFSFHYMQLGGYSAREAMRASARKVWEKKGFLIAAFLLINLTGVLLTALFSGLLIYLGELLSGALAGDIFWSRFSLVFLLLSAFELLNLFVFLMMPLQIHLLTGAYSEFGCEARALLPSRSLNEGPLNEGPLNEGQTSKPRKAGRRRRLLVLAMVLILLFNLAFTFILSYFFDDIYRWEPDIEIVAHRGGGDLGPENSLVGMMAAAEAGAKWSEIDVMRSKDGVYIINHDKTFARLSGLKKKPSDLSWKEIQELEIKNAFKPGSPSAKVPSLEEVMEAAKGRIGLFIELKAPAADRLMVDDVVGLIKEKKMEEEAVIIALDYSLIEYLEANYPEIESGYLYYFAMGNTAKINSDYLIMEEGMLSAKAVSLIHSEGKKAVVWTVNSFKHLKDYVDTRVDGLITDHVLGLQEALYSLGEKSDIDLIWLYFRKFIEGVLN